MKIQDLIIMVSTKQFIHVRDRELEHEKIIRDLVSKARKLYPKVNRNNYTFSSPNPKYSYRKGTSYKIIFRSADKDLLIGVIEAVKRLTFLDNISEYSDVISTKLNIYDVKQSRRFTLTKDMALFHTHRKQVGYFQHKENNVKKRLSYLAIKRYNNYTGQNQPLDTPIFKWVALKRGKYQNLPQTTVFGGSLAFLDTPLAMKISKFIVHAGFSDEGYKSGFLDANADYNSL